MGEAKRRKKLGLPPREINSIKKNLKSTGRLNAVLNKYPWLPYIVGLTMLIVLILDLFNYYS